jgi:enoyl-CoA hydratase/carnithine racemase
MDHNTAAALGLLTHLVEPSAVSATLANIAVNGKPENKYSGRPVDKNHPVAQFSNAFYSNENMETLLSGSCPEGFDTEDKQVGRQLRSLSRTAPIALSMASGLLDDAINTDDLDSGLALELDRLSAIFGTSDALEGLSALIEGRRPEYTNN